MGQEGLDFGGAHGLGVAFLVEKNETPDPVDVSLFGAIGIVLEAQGIAELIEKFGRHTA